MLKNLEKQDLNFDKHNSHPVEPHAYVQSQCTCTRDVHVFISVRKK